MSKSLAIRVTVDGTHPIHDYLLAEPITEERSLAGLVIPVNGSAGNDHSSEHAHAYRVVKVGEGRVSQYSGKVIPNPDIRPGDFILAPGEMMLPLYADDRPHILVKTAHVVCVIRPDANDPNGANNGTKNPAGNN